MFGIRRVTVLSVIACALVIMPVASSNLDAAIIDFAGLSLGAGGYTYYTAAGGGEFGFSSGGNKLLTLQSGGAVVASGIVTSVIASQATLNSDDSAGGEVNGTFANDNGITVHTLTFIGWLYAGGQAPYNVPGSTLLIAQATGLGEMAEVPGSGDDIQIQYNYAITGGGLFDGSAGHQMHPTFDATYTFDASLAGGGAPTDLSSDLSFGLGGDSSILMTPEPVTSTLLGLGSLGLLRIRKRKIA